MPADPTPITIQILDKDYTIGCSEDERDALQEAAQYLDSRMREIRDGGKVVGSERVAVITALNLASELLQSRQDKEQFSREVRAGLERIGSKVGAILQGDFSRESA